MITGVLLILTALFCSLVAGFLFAFAVVIMPGIKNLNDREFIQAFQVIDNVIQKNQPLFMLVWLGSVIISIAALISGIIQLDGLNLLLLITAVLIYLPGVQLPTIIVNVPLNNRLQALDASRATDTDIKIARDSFETRWNRWNRIRTVLACLASLLLIILLFLI